MRANAVLPILLAASVFSLSSCGLFFATTKIETNLDAMVEKIDSEDISSVPDKYSGLDGINEILFEDDIEYLEFNEGNAALAYNERNAWVFDFKLNKVIPIVDFDAMFAAADLSGRGYEYFDGDLSLSVNLAGESKRAARFDFIVQGDEGCEYSVYAYYYLLDKTDNQDNLRGQFSNYNYYTLIYPGSDIPVTIDDVADYEKLAILESEPTFKVAKAIIENDIDTLAEALHVKSEVLSSWRGMKISEYKISRDAPLRFDENGLSYPSFELYLKIDESSVGSLPAGEYIAEVGAEVDVTVNFKNINESSEALNSPIAEYVSLWAYTYGAMNPEDMTVTNDRFIHAMLDSTTWYYKESEPLNLKRFSEYCNKHFGVTDVENYIDEGYVTGHGGHGLNSFLAKVRQVDTKGDISVVTVDYYAEPMYTVVAETREFTVRDLGDGGYAFEKTEITYDSGYGVIGYAF